MLASGAVEVNMGYYKNQKTTNTNKGQYGGMVSCFGLDRLSLQPSLCQLSSMLL